MRKVHFVRNCCHWGCAPNFRFGSAPEYEPTSRKFPLMARIGPCRWRLRTSAFRRLVPFAVGTKCQIFSTRVCDG